MNTIGARSLALGLLFLSLHPCAGGVAEAAGWTLIGWNNLGMHCTDGDFSVFSLLPPYNTIAAQLVDPQGNLVTDASGVTVTYAGVADPSGSINVSSQGKLNFAQHVQELFGVALGPEQGLAGKNMPGPGNVPQAMTFDPAFSWFLAEGIPITPYDDAGHKNYYPMMRLTARSAGGAVLATTDVVLPVSDEMDCRTCHSSTSPPAARPAGGWITDPNPEREFRLNILRLHDEQNAGDLTYDATLSAAGYNPAGLFATQADGQSILCANCHLSEALPGSGRAGVKPLTEALHGLHAAVTDPENGMTLGSVDNRSACYRCHPGSVTRCLRGAMGAAVAADGTLAMQCQSCHGSMSKVGMSGRTGWLDEPSCQECHTGTALQNNGQIRFTSVFEPNGQNRVAVNSTFATNPDTPLPGFSLFRFSTGHGGLQCEACHGSTHAEFPASHDNDNIQSIQHQGHVGTLAECVTCHGAQPNTVNGGPHGMHPVGAAWIDGHKDAAEQGGASQCRSCHGADYRGTVLSRSFADRSLNTELGAKYFWRGFQIGCYTCHLGPNSDDRNPNRAPVVANASASTAVDIPVDVALSASDADGNPLTLRIVSQSAHGAVGLSAAVATYHPDPGYSGADSFTFAAWDGSTNSNLGTVSLTVGGSGGPTPTATQVGAATPTPTAAAAASCSAGPRSGCRGAGASKLLMRRDPTGDRDSLLWKWTRGAATDQSEFADPRTTAAYDLCVYDARGALLSARAAAGAERWRALGERGFSYRDKSGSGQGVTKVVMKGSESDRARIVLKAGGAHLPTWPAGPLSPTVVVQWVNTANGLCWQGRYAAADVTSNDGTQFKATELP